MCVNDSVKSGVVSIGENSKCHGCYDKGVPRYCDRWFWDKEAQAFVLIELCTDCGLHPERTLDGAPFGGYDRPLCNWCVAIENEAISRYVELYGNTPSDKQPDFKETLADFREEIRQEDAVQSQADRNHDEWKESQWG